MTLIMWCIYPHEGIEIYTDTLMTTSTGENVGETNKYFVTPANVVIAGTGGADTIQAWQSLNATTLADLDELVAEAEQQLPSIHDSILGDTGNLVNGLPFWVVQRLRSVRWRRPIL